MCAAYRNMECPNCGRVRVLADESGPGHDGVCEKCGWDVDAGTYACESRYLMTGGFDYGFVCLVCRGEADRETGECRDAHWHGLLTTSEKDGQKL